MRRVAIIPARSGSVRIPNKNRRLFNGRPMIAWTLELLRKTRIFDTIVVSLDCDEMAETVAEADTKAICHYRSQALCKDHVGTQEVSREVVDALCLSRNDIVCTVYPTAGIFISPEDIKSGMRLLLGPRAPLHVFTVGSNPLRDAGQWYWTHAGTLLARVPLIHTQSVVYPLPEGSFIDINIEEDWLRAEEMFLPLEVRRRMEKMLEGT